MFYFNPEYILMVALPSFVLMAITSWYVRFNFKKWGKVFNTRGISGSQAIEELKKRYHYLNINSTNGVEIVSQLRVAKVSGSLSDHYDPSSKTIRLSPEVADGRTVAALAIAAHELGHAIQDEENYWGLKLRSAMVPIVRFGSSFGWILIFAGLIINFVSLSWIGLILFSGTAAFSLVTLPVEFDASRRAKVILQDSGIVTSQEERQGVNQMLNAAALTYVAALITSLLQVAYWASIISRRQR